MKVVRRSELEQVALALRGHPFLGLDTETSGLRQGDKPFLVIVATEKETYLFNLQDYDNLEEDVVLTPEEVKTALEAAFTPTTTTFIQNAKFDLRMVRHLGISVGAPWCTYSAERILKNNHFGATAYSLDAIAKRRFPETQKIDLVKKYITKHKLYDLVEVPGKAKRQKEMHFELVPHELMWSYAARDAELHLAIGLQQMQELTEDESLQRVAKNEIRLTKTCYKMERQGICIDKAYTARALSHEMALVTNARREFESLTGVPYVDSNKVFAEIFTGMGLEYPKTEKGNPSFNAESLEAFDNPAARAIKTIRNHEKRAGTYYSSFLYCEVDGKIHPDIRQAGTETGRFSYRDPNLQNVPKEEVAGLDFYVRKCFVPSPGNYLVFADYSQQEFRIMLDFAGETKLIQQVNDGADVHTATADLLGISRTQAKTINFGLLYGMGQAKLAHALGVSVKEAKDIKLDYFGKLPRVERLIRSVIRTGETRGHIFNWFGRKCHIAQRDFAYILPNHLIQSSGADVIKLAMNRIDDFLKDYKTTMLVQVHDEIILDVPPNEFHIIPEIKKIMENAYEPRNGMRLGCSVEHSAKSWGFEDRIEGLP